MELLGCPIVVSDGVAPRHVLFCPPAEDGEHRADNLARLVDSAVLLCVEPESPD